MTDRVTAPPDAPAAGPEHRLILLDALRGLALLGILLINIEFFHRSIHDFMRGIEPAPGAAGVAAWVIYVFVQGKFWVLFSLLFGVGFALMQERMEASGRSFTRPYLRRTLALACFGVLHIVLIWPGDILLAYALAGLMLLAFMQVRGIALVLSGVGLYAAVSAVWLLFGASLRLLSQDDLAELAQDMGGERVLSGESDRLYANGDFLEISLHRAQEYFGELFESMLMFQVPMTLGVFLLGVWLLRSGRLRQPRAHLRFWMATLLGGAAVAFVFIQASLQVGTRFEFETGMGDSLIAAGLMALGSLPLTLAYLAACVLLFLTPLGARVLSVLAPAGRMALTNYLLQSLICSLLFYGYGLGAYGQLDRWQQTQVALAIFAAQSVISALWLRRYRFGPMEWVWRGLTYGRLPRLRH